MSEPIIICPNCGTNIPLTESLAAPLLEATRAEFQKQMAEKDAAIAGERQRLDADRKAFDAKVAELVRAKSEAIANEEADKARAAVAKEVEAKAEELRMLQGVLSERNEKLAAAQKAQVELIRKERELDDAKREMELTVARRVQAEIGEARDQARRDAEQSLGLKVREKEETIASMQRQIEDLRRKAEQGSQQLQGEVLELELESLLRRTFPTDLIEPVPKGEFGGDLIHRVVNQSGSECGTILWETKRTRNWSDLWLAKLRSDQRAAKADTALIVSQALPKGVETFGQVDGVWVASPRCAIPVAMAIRELLLSVAHARLSGEGQKTKTTLVYEYLTGSRFRHRIEAIVEKFADMQHDLEVERKTMTKLWSRREQQIRGVIESTSGMYGDLQGIAGKSIQEIDGLSFPLLDGPPDERE